MPWCQCHNESCYCVGTGTAIVGARYPWSPNSIHQAKAIMMFNLAATHAVRGEHEKALQHLAKVLLLFVNCKS